jgi:methoxymalonate biosynthesis acyl carrier protein
MVEIKETIKLFLSKFFRKYELGDDEDLFSLGFVNSLFAMQLVMFLEKEFNIQVENKDLNMDNFRTINSIASFVTQKVVGKREVFI